MKILIFKIISLIIIVESFVAMLPVKEWYEEIDSLAKNNSVKYIFIGASRVGYSINPAVFTKYVSAGDCKYFTINMGRGYSTTIEHYFGIRRIASFAPDKLKGVTVFLEAPHGIPLIQNPILENWSWQNSWIHPDDPELLVTTMKITDLGAFWKSGTDFHSKLIVTAAMLSGTINLKGRWQRVVSSLRRLQHANISELAKNPQFLGAEIITDRYGIENARKIAQTDVKGQIEYQKLLPHNYWDTSIIKSLNELVTSSGGHLVLFNMPVSSMKQKVFTTEIGKRNKEIVQNALISANIPVIVPDMKTTDYDFPDFWHLRGSRSVEYTQSVAQAYLNLKKNKGW
jgi:hypothetical protein